MLKHSLYMVDKFEMFLFLLIPISFIVGFGMWVGSMLTYIHQDVVPHWQRIEVPVVINWGAIPIDGIFMVHVLTDSELLDVDCPSLHPKMSGKRVINYIRTTCDNVFADANMIMSRWVDKVVDRQFFIKVEF